MAPPSGQQATDSTEIHLMMQGAKQGVIKGESSSKAHEGEIEVSAFAWGVGSAPISTGKGKPSLTNVTITKSVDRASTNIINASLTSEVITTAKISWSKSTGFNTTEDFLIVTLTNAYVNSVQINSGMSGGSGGLGTEVITLSYQKIDIVYKQQTSTGLMQAAGGITYYIPGAATS